MKFTEEQYQKIIGAWNSRMFYTHRTQAVVEAVCNETMEQDMLEALAIANPLTREWAHEQFVEEEKRYFWSTKKKNKKGKAMTLFKSAGGIAQMVGTKHALTESKIREWGYDPERFDKEEVE